MTAYRRRDLLASESGDSSNSTSLVLIDGKVYDVHDFIAVHPGGNVIKTHLNGEDATNVFAAFHPASAYETLADYYVGDLVEDEDDRDKDGVKIIGEDEADRGRSVSVCRVRYIAFAYATLAEQLTLLARLAHDSLAFTRDVDALRNDLEREGMFQSNKLYYIFKVCFNYGILGTSMWLLHAYGDRSWTALLTSAFLLGLFWQQSGYAGVRATVRGYVTVTVITPCHWLIHSTPFATLICVTQLAGP